MKRRVPMADPYLDRGESFIITTHRISCGFALYDMILTTRNLVLVDNRAARFAPQKTPLLTVLSVTAGRVSTGEPAIILHFFEDEGGSEQQPMNLLFTQQPGEHRKGERDIWIQKLMEQIVAVRQSEDAARGTVVGNGEGYIHPTSAPPRGIETVQPHKSVVPAEPATVELSIRPEEPEVPALPAKEKVPVGPAPETPAAKKTAADAREEPAGGLPAPQPVPVQEPEEPVLPPRDTTPVQEAGSAPVPEGEVVASSDPFAAAIEAMREVKESPDIRFIPSIPEPEQPAPAGARTGLFGSILASARSLLHPKEGEEVPPAQPPVQPDGEAGTVTASEGGPAPVAATAAEPVQEEEPAPAIPQEPEPPAMPVPEETAAGKGPAETAAPAGIPVAETAAGPILPLEPAVPAAPGSVEGAEETVQEEAPPEEHIPAAAIAPALPADAGSAATSSAGETAAVPEPAVPAGDAGMPEGEKKPPVPPAGTILLAAVAVVLVCAAAAFLFTYPFAENGVHQVTIVPTPPVSPQATTLQPSPAPSGPAPYPAATIPPAFSSGVWVRIGYNYSYVADIGNPGSLQNVGGTGEHYYWIRNADGLVQVSIRKQDYSADPLTVTVYRNGSEIYSNTLTAPKGSLDFIIDPVTGGFPGGIPTPVSGTGFVPGVTYRHY